MKFFLFSSVSLICHLNFSLEGTASILELETQIEIKGEGAPSNFGYQKVNRIGNVVWSENVVSHITKTYFWSEQSGTIEIDLYQKLIDLGFEPVKKSSSVTNFSYGPTYFDDQGNVFITFSHKTPSDIPDHKLKKNTQNKIGVWNRKEGFRLINVPDVDHVLRSYFTDHFISVVGFNRSFEKKFMILKNSLSSENDNVGTPWDKLPIGEIGKRLYVLERLYQSALQKKKEYLIHSVDLEAGHILDVLQYHLKKAEFEIKKSEGKDNFQAERDFQDALDGIEALKNILKGMGIKNSKVFSLDLPSNSWIPEPRL